MSVHAIPLTSTQQGIWFADIMAEQQQGYVISHCIEMPGNIHSDLLVQAIQQGLNEADTVMAQYRDGQQILPNENEDITTIPVECIDLSDQAQGREQAFAAMWQDTQRPLALDTHQALCVQQLYFIRDQGQPVWLWYQRYHHIMLDGFSFTNLTKRIAEIYNGLILQHSPSAAPFTSVANVIEEENQYQTSSRYQDDKRFWQTYCQDMPTQLSMSHRKASTTANANSVLRHISEIDARLLEQLALFSKSTQSSQAELLMGLVAAYVYRLTGQSEQVLGLPFMRRMSPATAMTVAPTVNVLPLKMIFNGLHNWLDVAHQFQQSLKHIRRHQRYSAEQILRDSQRVGEENGLYSTLVNYKPFDYQLDFSGIKGITHHLATGPVDDFEFSIIVEQQRTYFELRANSQRYDEADLKQHAQRLTTLLNNWLAHPDTALADVSILPEKEKQQLLTWGTGRQFEQTEYHNILDIFWQNVAQKPTATALICRDTERNEERYTFAELGVRVSQLSRLLLAQGACKGQVVATALPRSADAVMAMMAVLHSGATYLPLDLDYPIERMEMMCEDTQPCLLLSHSNIPLALSVARLDLDSQALSDHLLRQEATPLSKYERPLPNGDDIAYVIFTSGSTGRPKGVMNTHGALLNLLLSHQESIYRPAQQVVQQRYPGRALHAAHTHSFSFDSSWLQIFWLIQGEELYVFDEDTRRDAFAMVNEVHQLQIDAMDLPPSLLAQLLNNGLMEPQTSNSHQPSLILIGGEACPTALWRQLRSYPQLTSHNLYGPTEYTVDTLRAELSLHTDPVVGRPISNTRAYILDANLQPVPIGCLGELYISGKGLAAGYLARAELSASRFVADPYSHQPGARMYRTGDIVRWSCTGQIEFMGRGDDQVKIRGYRVELGEVENALSLLPEVESALVIAEAVNNSHRLIGYCVIAGLSLEQQMARATDLLEQLRQQLPEYMVPSAILVMEAFPRNVSGKIDKKALPSVAAQANQGPIEPPQNAQEAILCQAIAEVLKLTAIGAMDDFFNLGGDSISAIMLCTELRQAGYGVRPSQVFSLRTPRALAPALERIETNSKTVSEELAWQLSQEQQQHLLRAFPSMADAAPLLPLQKGMLFETLMDSASGNYNAFTRLHLEGELDSSRLQCALDALLVRYPQLAGAFDHECLHEPVLVIPSMASLKSSRWPLSEHDLSTYDMQSQPEALAQLEQELLRRHYPTDRFHGMIHAALVKLSHRSDQAPSQFELILIVHHLLIDGWSTPLLLKDLLSAYQAQTPRLTPQTIGYKDVVSRLYLRDQHTSLVRWQAAVSGIRPCVLFEQKQDAVSEIEFHLSADLSQRLTSTLRQQGLTLNVMMQAVWALMLQSLSGREDIVFGTPVSGRSADIAGIGEQIGLFLNTLPTRVQLDSTRSLWAQLPAMQQQHIELLEHDTLGLAEIQQLCGGQTLFDTLLVVENYPDNAYLDVELIGQDGRSLKVRDIQNRGYSHYPLALLVIPGERLSFLIENRGALSKIQEQALMQRLQSTLELALEDPDRPLCHYPLLSASESHQLAEVNNTYQPVPALTLQQALRNQADATPNAPCLIDDEIQLSFHQARVNVQDLAQRLRDRGVREGDIVAVALPRSVKLSLAIWAIIEAGAAYLPLDLGYPDDRIRYMLADAKPSLLITCSDASQRLFGLASTTSIEIFDAVSIAKEHREIAPSSAAITPAHPAYLIYTSATTGRPKGVLVSHGAIINRILWMQNEYALTDQDVVLQKTPCSFDVSVWEFFWAPMVGANLVMAPPEAHKDPEWLKQIIEQYQVTTLHFVPSMLAIFTASMQLEHASKDNCPSLKQVFCSGEALLKAQVSAFQDCFGVPLHNLYGPTEAAVDVTYKPAYDDLASQGQGIAIGRPVWNTQLRILDQYLRPVPIGSDGELYLCGEQLALGYLDRPELNCARFVADPYGPAGTRMYRTGDIARWRENGDVEYLGRADNQIKIRGQRIELGEIENQLLDIEAIEQVVVVATVLGSDQGNNTGQDNRQLVAYVVPHDGHRIDENKLRAQLAEHLPAHMLPAAYVSLTELPLSANGKLDRNGLPAPTLSHQTNAEDQARLPHAGLEFQLAKLFSQLLEIETIYADDDFFALGGHSLMAMRLAADIRRTTERAITVGQIMINSSVAKLAKVLEQDELRQGQDKLDQMLENTSGFDDVIYLREGHGQPLFCFYPGSGFAWQYSVLSRYLKSDRPIIGLQSPRPNGLIASSKTLDELISKQLDTIQREQAHGPYYLLGYSLGGSVAYGVAAKLREQGEQVNFLGLLDTYPAEVHDWNDPQGEEEALGAEREQAQLLNEAILNKDNDEDNVVTAERDAMLGQIFANYRDAVQLLKKAQTAHYDQALHVFVAQQSLPDYIQPQEHWQAYAPQVRIHPLSQCSHESIMSPEHLQVLGPLLGQLLMSSENADSASTSRSNKPLQTI